MRVDETWFRLREWTRGGQPDPERLAAQILDAEGYKDIDPSHPLGGPDGGRDGECTRDGEKGVWAVYFARGEVPLNEIETKLAADIGAARKYDPKFLAFVTNQELRLSERTHLRSLGGDVRIDLFHLERVAGILDRPLMAPVRERFLQIAAGPPPMLIKTSVIGIAHAFTDDTEVLDRFVGIRETQIRKKSDEGHARVRAEQEEKRRAEDEKLAREAREAAEKARKAAMDAVVPKRPWDVGIEIPRMSELLGQSGILDSIAKQYTAAEILPRIPGIPGTGEPPRPPEPLSDEQIEAKVARYRSGLERRWPSCRDYLAGIAWPGLRFRIENEVKNFLTDMEVVLTFHGARGVDFEEPDEFELLKVQDPSWEPPRDPLYYTAVVPALQLARPADYPIDWLHNDDGDLEVTITLPRLRPLKEWRSDEYREEIVLVVDPGADVDEITVTYIATAHGYGDVFEGEPITVPVEKVAMLDVLLDVIEAQKAS